ncbi:HGxxPAAW family protein [Streptomyces sp. NPDC048751]|uniref:HGxxPAAW family protein n=1 Tax=Streptomyces sp. NPDC048751 TaxID=3365591 RepID=UPI003722C445
MSAEYDEGHTIAGWTGVGIATVGSSVAGVGVCMVSAPLVSGGLAIVVLALLVTWGLHLAGWGKPPGVRPREQWGMRVRDTRARGGHGECLGCRLAGRGRRTVDAAVAVPRAAGASGPSSPSSPEAAVAETLR